MPDPRQAQEMLSALMANGPVQSPEGAAREAREGRLLEALRLIYDMPLYPTVAPHEVEGLRSRYNRALEIAAEALGEYEGWRK